jgi:hypothetical protein
MIVAVLEDKISRLKNIEKMLIERGADMNGN